MTKTPHSSETETATESAAEQRPGESESESESTAQTDDSVDTEFDTTDTDTGSAPETAVASSDAVLERNGGGSETGTAAEPTLASTKIRRYLVWGALGGCALLTLVATVQFYWSVGAAIDLWVDQQYRPVMHAAFNLVVLLGSLIGISLLVRDLN